MSCDCVHYAWMIRSDDAAGGEQVLELHVLHDHESHQQGYFEHEPEPDRVAVAEIILAHAHGLLGVVFEQVSHPHDLLACFLQDREDVGQDVLDARVQVPVHREGFQGFALGRHERLEG
jgi:hypothetical protein